MEAPASALGAHGQPGLRVGLALVEGPEPRPRVLVQRLLGETARPSLEMFKEPFSGLSVVCEMERAN